MQIWIVKNQDTVANFWWLIVSPRLRRTRGNNSRTSFIRSPTPGLGMLRVRTTESSLINRSATADFAFQLSGYLDTAWAVTQRGEPIW